MRNMPTFCRWVLLPFALCSVLFSTSCVSSNELDMHLNRKGVVWRGKQLAAAELKELLREQRIRLGPVQVVVLCEPDVMLDDLRGFLYRCHEWGFPNFVLKLQVGRTQRLSPQIELIIIDVPDTNQPWLPSGLQCYVHISGDHCFVNGQPFPSDRTATSTLSNVNSTNTLVTCSVRGEAGPLLRMLTDIQETQPGSVSLGFTQYDDGQLMKAMDERLHSSAHRRKGGGAYLQATNEMKR